MKSRLIAPLVYDYERITDTPLPSTHSTRFLAQVPGLARFIYLFVVALSLHIHYELSVPKEMPYADLDLYCKVYWVCDVVFTLTS